ncbi:hypothetical protein G7B40_009240 [Aetokthonos hydrillicola Thurmond2011]|jgi:hypothetical protein|uniref:Uncharacterized protein n=1 Tax=Aetokthonos hydrillicola Thurmond2011 TaxID=2712845 RepID=A0AAP5I4T0_9CYAN|nr:hypothetical protein [Aetokthonos hydrillicola]MBO3457568.1 hypothetical protein [Aetokthonos hydrillicola CCALA 1050]MBW4590902.1 hypothetical protein [Aetokthonos hydrillicola CCALA 1050]MDR9894751.1 hypothetical protein [Aetokthonos hydrillicola Thurmond2011]
MMKIERSLDNQDSRYKSGDRTIDDLRFLLCGKGKNSLKGDRVIHQMGKPTRTAIALVGDGAFPGWELSG